MISIKSVAQIDKMKRAGEIVALTHELMKKNICDGVTTKELDRIAEEFIRAKGAIPSFKNYNGYPASICVSVNNEVVHGIPSKKKFIKEGDIVSLDAGLIYQGYHADAARTWAVGQVHPELQRLIDVTREKKKNKVYYLTMLHLLS